MISSAEEVVEGDPEPEEEVLEEDSEMVDTVTTADSSDDPDYAVGS